jgi:hypothetical protein
MAVRRRLVKVCGSLLDGVARTGGLSPVDSALSCVVAALRRSPSPGSAGRRASTAAARRAIVRVAHGFHAQRHGELAALLRIYARAAMVAACRSNERRRGSGWLGARRVGSTATRVLRCQSGARGALGKCRPLAQSSAALDVDVDPPCDGAMPARGIDAARGRRRFMRSRRDGSAPADDIDRAAALVRRESSLELDRCSLNGSRPGIRKVADMLDWQGSRASKVARFEAKRRGEGDGVL